jgi:hypothetical protein
MVSKGDAQPELPAENIYIEVYYKLADIACGNEAHSAVSQAVSQRRGLNCYGPEKAVFQRVPVGSVCQTLCRTDRAFLIPSVISTQNIYVNTFTQMRSLSDRTYDRAPASTYLC